MYPTQIGSNIVYLPTILNFYRQQTLIMNENALTSCFMKSDMGNKTGFVRKKKCHFFNVNSLNIVLRRSITLYNKNYHLLFAEYVSR